MKASFYFTAGIFLLFEISGYAQNNNQSAELSEPATTTNNNSVKTEKSLEEKLEGTYMFINKSSKVIQLITVESLKEIELRRHATLDVYYEVSPYLTIKILPKSVIEAPDFDPKKYQ